jgi:hypothetical protein
VRSTEAVVTCDEEVGNELEPVGAWEKTVGVRRVMKAWLQQGFEAVKGGIIAATVV